MTQMLVRNWSGSVPIPKNTLCPPFISGEKKGQKKVGGGRAGGGKEEKKKMIN